MDNDGNQLICAASLRRDRLRGWLVWPPNRPYAPPMRTRRTCIVSPLLSPLSSSPRRRPSAAKPTPLVATVHVALCDNTIINCGTRTLGNGDRPARNLYWGGAAGLEAFFRLGKDGWRRAYRDSGDGKLVLERVVYRRRVEPAARWRRLGVNKSFEMLLVGLAYRGRRIDEAMKRFVSDVRSGGEARLTMTVGHTNRVVAYGGASHLVGYAGHNHLMDVTRFAWPRRTRTNAVGYFALACLSAPYLEAKLSGEHSRALLLTKVLMYPGAFTIAGLLRGVGKALPLEEVFRHGADAYAHYQKKPKTLIRRIFTYGGRHRRGGSGKVPAPTGQ
jgi:hypothetical protein